MVPQDQSRAPTPVPKQYEQIEYVYSPEPSSKLSRFAAPFGLLVGMIVTGGTTYALVRWVLNSINNASVDGDPTKWRVEARSTVYDACYNGCDKCDDPLYAFNACEKSAQVKVKGVICDANKMWSWRGEARYPPACIDELARMLQGDGVGKAQQSHRSKLALVIVTVLLGALCGYSAIWLWHRFTTSEAERDVAKTSLRTSRGRTWRLGNTFHCGEKPHDTTYHSQIELAKTPDQHVRFASHSPSLRSYRSRSSSRESQSMSLRGGGGGSHSSWSSLRLLTAFLALFGGSRAVNAYPCTGKDVAFDQYFMTPTSSTNGGNAISGVISGWLSNCYDRDENCHQLCHKSCTTRQGDRRTCKDKCRTKCTKRTHTDRKPMDFVQTIAPKVKACGFQLADKERAVKYGGKPEMRVANAGIEKDLWVRISVSEFNVTTVDKVDGPVMCLHGLGGK